MFGSDWPVCLRAASYAEVLNALRTIVDPLLGSSEMDDVFGANAVRFYRLAGAQGASR
jgi:L-fuconolactonase